MSTEQEQAADVAAVAVPLLGGGKWINGSVVTTCAYGLDDTSTFQIPGFGSTFN
jgi:hypothetical protein